MSEHRITCDFPVSTPGLHGLGMCGTPAVMHLWENGAASPRCKQHGPLVDNLECAVWTETQDARSEHSWAEFYVCPSCDCTVCSMCWNKDEMCLDCAADAADARTLATEKERRRNG